MKLKNADEIVDSEMGILSDGFDEQIERRRLKCVDEVRDAPVMRCLRCGSRDNMEVDGPDFCKPCRQDIWEHAQSYGSGDALRILERMNKFRRLRQVPNYR